MNRVTRNRERNLHVIDAVVPMDGGEFVMRRAPGARVGIETAGTIGAYGSAIDNHYTSLEGELRDHYEAKWGKDLFVIRGKIPIPNTEYFYYFVEFNPTKLSTIPAEKLNEYRADKNFFSTWETDLQEWRTYWVDIVDSVPVPLLTAPFIKDKLDVYETKYRGWQKLAADAGVKTVVAPLPPKVDADGNPLDGFSGLLKNITWVIGLGFVFYIFTMFIAPPLLSGAARTKEGYRGLRD